MLQIFVISRVILEKQMVWRKLKEHWNRCLCLYSWLGNMTDDGSLFSYLHKTVLRWQPGLCLQSLLKWSIISNMALSRRMGRLLFFHRNMKCVVGEHWLCLFQVDHSFFKISFAVASWVISHAICLIAPVTIVMSPLSSLIFDIFISHVF